MSNWNLRFRRRLQLVPGINLNLNKNSASVSLGPRHAKLTVGPRGIRQTVGLPGSGFYLTKEDAWQSRGALRRLATPRSAAQSTAPLRHATQRQRSSANANPTGLVFTAVGGFLRGVGWVALAVLGLTALGSWFGH